MDSRRVRLVVRGWVNKEYEMNKERLKNIIGFSTVGIVVTLIFLSEPVIWWVFVGLLLLAMYAFAK